MECAVDAAEVTAKAAATGGAGAASATALQELNKDSFWPFMKEADEAGKLVIVDFYTDWSDSLTRSVTLRLTPHSCIHIDDYMRTPLLPKLLALVDDGLYSKMACMAKYHRLEMSCSFSGDALRGCALIIRFTCHVHRDVQADPSLRLASSQHVSTTVSDLKSDAGVGLAR